jgi:sulfite reductase alpha subunit-like flavoprotein
VNAGTGGDGSRRTATSPPSRVSERYPVPVVGNRRLSGPDSAKEVREFVLDLRSTPLTYQAGDALVVYPRNRPELVQEWLELTGHRGDSPVTLAGIGDTDLATALREHLEIAVPVPALLDFVATHTTSRELRRVIRGERSQRDRWLWGRQAVDVVADTGVQATAQEWCDTLTPLRERRYSISSAPEISPHEVRVLVSVVRYRAPSGTARTGVASGHLADSGLGQPVRVAIARSAGFAPPDNPETPMIMIGPGTGLAPFLGFLDARSARGHAGRNWLFFGEQHEVSDYYYRDELAELRRTGLLTRLDLAFSRDQRSKIYVQDRMRQHGAVLWRWLTEGARIYVCGDAARMARDVDATLRHIVAVHAGMSTEQADAHVRRLAADGRYLRDVY